LNVYGGVYINVADIKQTCKELAEGGNTAQERYDLAVKLEQQANALRMMYEAELTSKKLLVEPFQVPNPQEIGRECSHVSIPEMCQTSSITQVEGAPRTELV